MSSGMGGVLHISVWVNRNGNRMVAELYGNSDKRNLNLNLNYFDNR
jgi:hypothetical protein